ncbi:MAG: hypothetical protein K8S54_17225 [Spirochaetia bacterium]|nr:hypothetical protein [Spirochaetia bacterium]
MKQTNKKLFLAISGISITLVFVIGILMLAQPADSRKQSILQSSADPTRGDDGTNLQVDAEQLVADYRVWAQYPPNSRPLLESHQDVIDYKKIQTASQRMPVKVGVEFKDSGYSCLLDPKTHSVFQDEYMHIYLFCSRHGSREREPLRIQEVRLVGVSGDRKILPPPPTIKDDGTSGDQVAGDSIYTIEFRPRKEDWADMNLTVNFQIVSDGTLFTHSLATHFFSSPQTPARFTGQLSDKEQDGSLVVTVELTVLTAGNYTIEANLMHGTDPIGYARKDAKLAVGKQTVELLYYGKILRDREFEGPYEVLGLRGSLSTDVIQPEDLARSPAEVERFLANIRSDRPNRMLIPYFDKTYKTAPYRLEQFSDREYNSPEKEQRIADLTSLQR